MSNMIPPRPSLGTGPHSLGAAAERIRHRWGWIVAFGAFSAILGVVALVLTETATIASVLLIGIFMVMAGFAEVAIGMRTRTWGRMFLWEAAGIIYILAGIVAILLPEVAAGVITLLLGAGLFATGLLRIYLGFKMTGSASRGAVILAGTVTLLLGVLILAGWPNNSVLVLGTFLGIDLLFYGLTWMIFGYRIGHRRSL
ncbi:HdeD family acid-resistance protein [Lichenihabitans psoromatis]|uniref:HdeD family acid-resistance protein n=1 Tax=Lichenihabitans psoromatis TaxID=2528642 RepID=UPI001FE12C1D|nr:HdeD family acid-resistance protein [Lichenihabitans psoromatis]